MTDRLKQFLLAACMSPLFPAAWGQTVTVSPKSPSVGVGLTQQFTATVTGLSNTGVVWNVQGVKGGNSTYGTITSGGSYTAPSNVPGQNPVTVQAVASDGKTKASQYVLILSAGPTVTSASPNPIPAGSGNITVTGSGFVSGAQIFLDAVQLSTTFINPTTVKAGYYHGAASSATVRVINPGSTFSNTITVGVGGASSPLTVTPPTATVALGATQQFSASGSAVTWSASAGSISSSGLYTAPATMPSSNQVTITATSGTQAGTATITLIASQQPIITVSPTAATLLPGATQQFTASGQSNVTWSATAGSISASGLYTAPTVMPSSSKVTITASAAGSQSGTAIVTLTAPPITVSPASISLLIGTTQQFTASGQSNVTWSASVGSISATGLYTAPAAMPVSPTVTITATGAGNQSSTATVTLSGVVNPQMSVAAAHRFLQQAAFGPTSADVTHLQTIGYQAWLNEQFAMPQISNYDGLASSQGGLPNRFLTNAVMNPDQLRQRVALALSQICVISITKLIWNQNVAPYEDLLLADAFTNYRQILQDVTLSPSMGYYLDMANNAAANPAQGTVANENYAREVMQLFSIGTSMLNPDGSRQTDSSGNLIPAYNQTNVTELARVFTGWTFAPASGAPIWGINVDGNTNMNVPMVAMAQYHDSGSKTLLNGYVAPAGLSPASDLQGALDNLFAHPNVGPFIAKQLIQHLVKSNPSPAYVSRVVGAFNDNGHGVRGDMKAVITAILLDQEARANDNGGNDQPADGHLQEPALFLPGIIRAFDGQMNDQNYFASDLANLNQDIFNPASVFNYYSQSYTIPGTTLKGGPFQIFDTSTSIFRANLVSSFFSNYQNPIQTYGPGTTVDLTQYANLSNTPATLVDAIDNALTGGVLPAALKQAVVAAVQADTGAPPIHRVQTALFLILTSNYYNVWH